MTVTRYPIAAIQMTSGKEPDDNLRQAGALLTEARKKGACLAVLPENFAAYGGDYRALGERHDELVSWLCDQARSLDMAIIGARTASRYHRLWYAPVPSQSVLRGSRWHVMTSCICSMRMCRMLRDATGSRISLSPARRW